MKKTTGVLPIPGFYDSANAGRWDYRPNQQKLFENAQEWAKLHDIKPAATDRKIIVLTDIDSQKDFCYPEGTLFVGGRSGKGAIDDNDRGAQFVYRNLGRITEYKTTHDTHIPWQIFFPGFFLKEKGEPVGPNTLILADDLKNGKYYPNPAIANYVAGGDYTWLAKQCIYYCEELERQGKYALFIWPFHCLLGTEGHALAGVVEEAKMFHAFARGARNWSEVKGGNPLVENFSVLRPEVLTRWDGLPLAQKNVAFINQLIKADYNILKGQAGSHCVKSTIDDLLVEIMAVDPELAKKVYILKDCTSAVYIPGAGPNGSDLDFTPQMEDAFKKFEDAGMNLVESTTPMEDWPGMEL